MPHISKKLRAAILTAALSALCVVGASAASIGIGTVDTSALRLRAEASTDADILATASKGDHVVVLEDAGNGWYKVDLNTVEGYMSGEYLTVETQADVTIGYGKVSANGNTLNIRSGPGTGYDRVVALSDGAIVTITGIQDGWYKVKTQNGTVGYASSDYMVTCKESSGSRGTETATVAASTSSMGQQVAEYAKQFLGKPYVWGGNGPNSFDCSGFVKYVYAHFGYTLNRTATAQLSNGVSVSKAELQPGDLVFFRHNTSKPVSHVGLYLGGGQFIHASTNAYKVQIDTLSTGHYANVYVYGRRIF